MKFKIIILLLVLTLTLTSCTSKSFIDQYKDIEQDGKILCKGNLMNYEGMKVENNNFYFICSTPSPYRTYEYERKIK